MKILIINGSPHKGNTWALVEIIKKHMQELSNDEIVFDEVHLMKLGLPLCTGCSSCLIKGENKCPHHSEVQNLIEKIEESDATILASPCYANHVSALMKNFIDHLSYNMHRPRFFSKKLLVVSTAGGKGSKNCTKYLRETLMCWGYNRGYELPVISHSYGGYEPSVKDVLKCEKTARKFYKDVASGKLYPPTFVNLLVYNLFRGMSHSGDEGEFYDKEYWENTGLIHEAYDTKIPLSMYKRFLGGVIYFFAKKMGNKTKITHRS